jgi:hypothetical protein
MNILSFKVLITRLVQCDRDEESNHIPGEAEALLRLIPCMSTEKSQYNSNMAEKPDSVGTRNWS